MEMQIPGESPNNGGLGIWTLVDLLFILFGEFTDAEGRKVNTWKGL